MLSRLLQLIPDGKIARLAVAVAVLAGISWVVHFAYNLFSHLNTVTVSPTTVSLALDSQDDEEAFTTLNLSNMQPGANAYVGMTVANTGSSGFRFSMASTASGDGALARDVRIGIEAVPAGSCSSSGYAAGTLLHRVSTGLSGASVTGQRLAAADSTYLCFHVQLPLALPKSLLGQAAQATLDFTAEP